MIGLIIPGIAIFVSPLKNQLPTESQKFGALSFSFNVIVFQSTWIESKEKSNLSSFIYNFILNFN